MVHNSPHQTTQVAVPEAHCTKRAVGALEGMTQHDLLLEGMTLLLNSHDDCTDIPGSQFRVSAEQSEHQEGG